MADDLTGQLKTAGGTLLAQAIPLVIPFLQSMITSYFSQAVPPAVPTVTPTGAVAHKSVAISDLQGMLNTLLKLSPPLDTDGWLGPKTEAAIEQAIAVLKAQGIG